MTPTPLENLISHCFRIWTWSLIIWEGLVFLFLENELFCVGWYPPIPAAFDEIPPVWNRLVFFNSVLDAQNDLKPPINQYDICCTYKKRLDYVVRSEKKWKGGSGGSGEGKNRSKKGSFDPKTAENRAPGGLTTPQTSQK